MKEGKADYKIPQREFLRIIFSSSGLIMTLFKANLGIKTLINVTTLVSAFGRVVSMFTNID